MRRRYYVFAAVRVCSAPVSTAKAEAEPDVEQPQIPASEPAPVVGQGKKLTAEERAAQVEFIRSLNQPTSEEQPKPGWDFDVDKPRTIQKL